ncbi:MAG: SDR family NAD(P)-dependent oxidoreductase, partial [Aestuariivirgaceae bacterium]
MVNALQGKNVLITGAANGIGEATALAFVQAGARVAGLDISPSRGEIPVIHCDLARESEIIDAVGEAVRQLGHIDVLVNNAGIM